MEISLTNEQLPQTIQGQEMLPDNCKKNIPFLLNLYQKITTDLGLNISFNDLPLVVTNSLADDTLAGVVRRVHLSAKKEVIKIELLNISFSAELFDLFTSGESPGYTKALMVAALTHELKHVSQTVDRKHLDRHGNINTKGEIEARNYAIGQLQNLMKDKQIISHDGERVIEELKSEIFGLRFPLIHRALS